eukprot:752413-Hanusia_phi.AAC.1
MHLSDYIDFMESHDPLLDKNPDWLVEFGLQAGHPLVDSHNEVGRRGGERGGDREKVWKRGERGGRKQ